jgi:hypothetical protein
VIGLKRALISNSKRVSGWLFDIYPLEDKMIFWIKQKNGAAIRLVDNWAHSIYVASDYKSDLKSILVENKENKDILSLIKDHKFVSRYEKIIDTTKSMF